MTITILGTGTSQGVPVIGCDCRVCTSQDPRDQRLRTSALFAQGGQHVQIDTGPDFRQQMLRAAPPYVDAILYTHEHADHTAGLDDVRPFNFMRRRDMPLYALPRTAAGLRKRFDYAFAERPYPGAPMLDLHEIDAGQRFTAGGMDWEAIPVLHGRLPILGFRTGDCVYLTDVKTLSPTALSRVAGCDTLIINALHHSEHYTHLNLEESLELIDQIAPRRAYLTHLSHRMGLHAEIERTLPPGVFIAYDGLRLELGS
jgi:phosphoribosyl 1,2-cyclic phosphate phosphodiesterase